MRSEKQLERDRRTAALVGVLFVTATVLYFIGGAVYGPSLESSDYLERAYPDRAAVRLGVLLEFVCVLAIPLIGMFLFPVLKRWNEGLALAYAFFRALEAVLLIGIEAALLSLIGVSQKYLSSTGMEASQFQAVGDGLRLGIDGAFVLYVLVFCVGALVLYSMLYTSRLVPRFLSIWGFLAAMWMLVGTALVLFEALSWAPDGPVEAIVVTPVAVNELVLAGWLMVKGFTSSAEAGGVSLRERAL